MREYKIEMLRNKKWKPASLPWNGLVGTTTNREYAFNMVEMLREEWRKARDNGDLLHLEYMPTKYRVFSREVSEWVEEKRDEKR